MDRDLLLRRTRERLVDRYGFVPVRNIDDKGGVHCSIMRHGGEYIHVVAKKQIWDDKASLLMKNVVIAASKERVVLCWFRDENEHWVFDAEYVLKNGRLKRAESKTHMTQWKEIPMHHGVLLDDYLNHRDQPSSIDQTHDASLERFA